MKGDTHTVQPKFRAMPHLLIYETLVHFLDTFRFFAGKIAAVFCQTRRVNPLIAGYESASTGQLITLG
jgi:predicted dehydrogenase